MKRLNVIEEFYERVDANRKTMGLYQSKNLGDALREAFTKSATVKRCIWNNGTWKVWI